MKILTTQLIHEVNHNINKIYYFTNINNKYKVNTR